MRIFLFLFINIIFSTSISNWVDLNNHIINSKLYKISFNYDIMDKESKFIIDDSSSNNCNFNNCNLIFYNNKISFETNDKIIIIDDQTIEMLNKNTKQVFIDYSSEIYKTIMSIDILDLVSKSQLIDIGDSNYYHIKYNNEIAVKIYLLDNDINNLEIFYDNVNAINVSNIKLSTISENNASNYFIIDYNSSEIFDLRNE